jgi:hypothetical protein
VCDDAGGGVHPHVEYQRRAKASSPSLPPSSCLAALRARELLHARRRHEVVRGRALPSLSRLAPGDAAGAEEASSTATRWRCHCSVRKVAEHHQRAVDADG